MKTIIEIPIKTTFTRNSDGRDVRVMAIADGWVMARLPGCIPWVMYGKDFLAKHTKKD